MSVHVLARFMDESNAELGARLVGMVMADAAGADGICWLGQVELARRTKLSERTVRDAIHRLEGLGEVETRLAQRGRRRINVYRIWCAAPPDYDRLPFSVDEPFASRPADSAGRDDRQSTTLTTGSSRPKRVGTPSIENQQGNRQVRVRWKVDKREVTEREEALARLILGYWNAATGQSLTNRDWLAMIVMRLREHPELELGDHQVTITSVLANPWWSGSPSPNVIYGSGAQFERSLMVKTQPTAGDRVEAERSRFAKILGGKS